MNTRQKSGAKKNSARVVDFARRSYRTTQASEKIPAQKRDKTSKKQGKHMRPTTKTTLILTMLTSLGGACGDGTEDNGQDVASLQADGTASDDFDGGFPSGGGGWVSAWSLSGNARRRSSTSKFPTFSGQPSPPFEENRVCGADHGGLRIRKPPSSVCRETVLS